MGDGKEPIFPKFKIFLIFKQPCFFIAVVQWSCYISGVVVEKKCRVKAEMFYIWTNDVKDWYFLYEVLL